MDGSDSEALPKWKYYRKLGAPCICALFPCVETAQERSRIYSHRLLRRLIHEKSKHEICQYGNY